MDRQPSVLVRAPGMEGAARELRETGSSLFGAAEGRGLAAQRAEHAQRCLLTLFSFAGLFFLMTQIQVQPS